MKHVNFYLQNPHGAENSHIRVRIRIDKGKYFQAYIGEQIPKSDWSVKSQRAHSTFQFHQVLNDYLDRLETRFNETRLQLRMEGNLNTRELKKASEKILYNRSPEIFEYFQQIIDEKNTSPQYSKTMGRKYKNVKDKIFDYDPHITFDQIDMDFFHKWTSWLYAKPRQLSTNTVHRYVKFLKTFLRECYEREYHQNRIFENRKFNVKKKKVLNPYLCTDELQTIYKKKMPSAHLENAKIELLKGCYSGLRHSDWGKLSLDGIRKIGDREYFTVIPQKSQGQTMVHIPAFPILKKLINRKSHPVSNQEMNRHIKDVCQIAEINQPFHKPTYKGNQEEIKECPKWKLVTSHIARRSFACNSIMAGVPSRIVMQVGGWKSEESFRNYLQLSTLDGMEYFDGVF